MNICIINCFDTWEHRAGFLYKVMIQEGHRVKVLTSDYKHMDKKTILEKKKDYKFFPAKPYARNLSLDRIYSHVQLSRDIFYFAEKNHSSIEMLWVLAPPNSFVNDAGKIKQRHPEIKVVIDIMDLWPETMPLGFCKKLPVFGHWKRLRDNSLMHADFVITECCLYRQILKKQLCGQKVQTIYLARENLGYNPHLNLSKDEICLCYLGSINHIVDIDAIINIVKECQKKKPVKIHIAGDGEKKEELIHKVENAGAKAVYHGKVYNRHEKQKIFDSCHYGLNIMKKSVCVGLTMKSVDYFEFGLPIINNIHGDTWNAVNRYHIGINWQEGRRFKLPEDLSLRRNARMFFERNLTEQAVSDNVRRVLEN